MGIYHSLKKLPNHTYLIMGIFLFVFVFPLINNASLLDIFLPISLTIMLLSIFSLIEKKKQKKMRWLSILVLTSLTFIWLHYFKDWDFYNYFSFIFNILVFLSATVILISEIVKSKDVTPKLIMEAISGYLLLGVMLTLANALIFSIQPESFNISGEARFSDITYFSFVTITTIGYGDISPQTDIARSVNIFFGISGQLYLTIIIALIVGKYLNKNNK